MENKLEKLAMCSACKKIPDSRGEFELSPRTNLFLYAMKVGGYARENKITHTLCEPCARKLYPSLKFLK